MVATPDTAVSRAGRRTGAAMAWRGCSAPSSRAVLVAATCLPPPGARGAAEASGIRDSEIEQDIRTLAAPVWRAAGLEPRDVAIYLVNDKQLNSFVAGGQAIFINTGLICGRRTPTS